MKASLVMDVRNPLVFLKACGYLCWLLLTLLVAFFVTGLQADPSSEWEAYKEKHGKVFGPMENGRRQAVWEKNREWIAAHNARADLGLESYRLGENRFTDYLKGDLTGLFGYVRPTHQSLNVPQENITVFSPDDARADTPPTLDYSTSSPCVGPVEDQGQCGSCWAFASVGTLQYCHCKNRNSGNFVNLSKQQIISCTALPPYFLAGCNGGSFPPAFRYMHDVGLLPTPSYIPSTYQARTGVCNPISLLPNANKVRATGVTIVPGNEDTMVQALHSLGPLAVAIYASPPSFAAYSKGIYSDAACSGSPNHAVLLVGYGKDEGKNYWIIKNEWGSSWGMGGYMRMARGVNMCSITSDVQTANC